MRIGIMTFWQSSDNYGQQMQMWALQQRLKSMGHDPYLIRYAAPPYSLTTRIREKLKGSKTEVVSNVIKALRKKCFKLDEVWIGYEDKRPIWNEHRDFEGFRRNYISCTNVTYSSYRQIIENPPLADAYITGSDQVWSYPTLDRGRCPYYLCFGPKTTKRISYAASIGRDLDAGEQCRFQEYLSAFDSVSVREESAQILCQSLGIDASVTLDPTLLLDSMEYDVLANAGEPPLTDDAGYMLVYLVNVAKPDCIKWIEASRYADEEDLKVMPVYTSGYREYPARELLPGYDALAPTVPGWIRLISEAACVLTSSFHGTVFSILMHRPFVTALLGADHARANDRVFGLLRALGLESRVLNRDMPFRDQMDASIDWREVDARLKDLKRESIDFLNDALR